MNKYQIKLGITNEDKVLQIPVMLDWELLDTENEINKIEAQINQDIAGLGIDFETTRFSHSGYSFTPPTTNIIQPTPTIRTSINYEFNFFSGGTINGTGSTQNWISDYNAEGFTYNEIYYYSNAFSKSFFKLDFYNSPSQVGHTNYLTVIIPTTQGEQM